MTSNGDPKHTSQKQPSPNDDHPHRKALNQQQTRNLDEDIIDVGSKNSLSNKLKKGGLTTIFMFGTAGVLGYGLYSMVMNKKNSGKFLDYRIYMQSACLATLLGYAVYHHFSTKNEPHPYHVHPHTSQQHNSDKHTPSH